MVKKYLLEDETHTVDLKWFIKNELKIQKDLREIDIINQSVTNDLGFSNYIGHNKKIFL